MIGRRAVPGAVDRAVVKAPSALTRFVGGAAERRAARHLKKRGYSIIEHNVWCGRLGEIDLVAKDGDTLVFVEVRYRATDRFGGGLASVDAGKRRKLARAAQHYLARNPFDGPIRFDVVALGAGDIDVAVDAFRPVASA